MGSEDRPEDGRESRWSHHDDVPSLADLDLPPEAFKTSDPCDCDVEASHELMPSGSYRANCPGCGKSWVVP